MLHVNVYGERIELFKHMCATLLSSSVLWLEKKYLYTLVQYLTILHTSPWMNILIACITPHLTHSTHSNTRVHLLIILYLPSHLTLPMTVMKCAHMLMMAQWSKPLVFTTVSMVEIRCYRAGCVTKTCVPPEKPPHFTTTLIKYRPNYNVYMYMHVVNASHTAPPCTYMYAVHNTGTQYKFSDWMEP